jgi:hypothetical protein
MSCASDPGGGEVKAEEKKLAEQGALLKAQLDGYVAQYGELIDAWKLLDTKAQIATATAGIFLAGAFAVLRGPMPQLETLEKAFLVAALVALIACVVCGIRALELRKISNPPRGSAFSEPFRDLYATAEFASGGAALQRRSALFMHDQMNLWDQAVRVQTEALMSKATWTKYAQRFLAAGALTFAILSFVQLSG